MLYFGDSSVFPESELNGSNIPGNPPSASSLEVTGSEYKEGGVQASWFYLAHLVLSLGQSHSGCTRGRCVQ